MRKPKMCQDCEHCVYICEGDFICDIDEPTLIIEEWQPTEDYYNCGGVDFEEQE